MIAIVEISYRNYTHYIGVVFPFMGSLSLDRYHVYFFMILKETLTFLLLSNLVLQYCVIAYSSVNLARR